MAVPATRADFKEYCLRKLGKPVIEINVDDDQVEDRIDEALKYYWDYHFDGSDKIYYRYQYTGAEYPSAANTVTINSGGTGYSNSDTLTISDGTQANAQITTYSNGTIRSISFGLGKYGTGYKNTSTVSVNTSTGSGANLSLITGDGSFTLPQNIIGAVNIFNISDPSIRSDDMFNIRYQIALNDLYTLTSISMVPYYMVMTHLGVISEMLVGKQPIRYNRHRNQLYVDMEWNKLSIGEYLLVEAYQIIDPDVFSDVWGDRWLNKYCTALIKMQWGNNMKKFSGMQLPGGVQMNGQVIYDEAREEIAKLEEDMINSYSLPATDMVG